MSFSRAKSTESPFISLASTAIDKILSVSPWQSAFWATVVPFFGSLCWYHARTVIEVRDGEQALWIRMWLSQNKAALRRVRHLMLAQPRSTDDVQRVNRWYRNRIVNDDHQDRERSAPPKFDFQPARGISAWVWFGWWPVSIASASDHRTRGDDGRFFPNGGGAYTLTVWFAPLGTSVVKDILLQGRQLWMDERAQKTEVWLFTPGRHEMYKVLTRPSRPLSSVIVDGQTKEALLTDAKRFLESEHWYVDKGLPYRRGYLLHGPPGCGKSSLVTALAGELRLPIVVIPLNSKHLDDERLREVMDAAPRESVVLIEDIDCALPREMEDQGRAAVTYGRHSMPVTFSGLLNAIDGVGAQEGRLLFLTTNYLNRLDDALIRPGRVDAKFYLGKASKEGAGELFDQFFASSILSGEHPKEAVYESRSAFLDNVEDGAHSFATLQGVLTTARDDPRLVGDGMKDVLAAMEAGEGIKPRSQRDRLEEVQRIKTKQLEKEKKDEQIQQATKATVVKRLTGDPVQASHNVTERKVTCNSFITYGAPGLFAESGVLYYEIEALNCGRYPQFGFALKEGIVAWDNVSGIGVGDNDQSWAVDGGRSLKWHKEVPTPWECQWTDGCVVGLAANVEKGIIAVSVDGVWEDEIRHLGVVFEDEAIKKGVFPCFSGSFCKLRYSFSEDDLKYSAPPASVWVKK